MFDWFVFFFGLFLGLLIFCIIVWITYSTRTVVFTNCARETPYCMDNDYINDPQEAESKGYADTLFVVNDKLYFERPKRNKCVHHLDRPMHIRRPMYCSVNDQTYRHLHENAYVKEGTNTDIIFLEDNCYSADGTGVPLARW